MAVAELHGVVGSKAPTRVAKLYKVHNIYIKLQTSIRKYCFNPPIEQKHQRDMLAIHFSYILAPTFMAPPAIRLGICRALTQVIGFGI